MEQKNERLLTKGWFVSLAAIFCCMLWGSAFPSIKVGYLLFGIESAASGSQILFAGCRFALAGLMVILFGSILQKRVLRPSRTSIGKVIKVCLFQTVIQYYFFYVGLAHTTGVKGSIVVASNVFLAILISSIFFRMEKLDAKKVIGCAIGFAGVVLVNLSGSSLELSFNLTGDGFIFISAISYAISSAMIKIYSRTEDPVMISGYQFFIGGMLMVFIGAGMGGSLPLVTGKGILLLAYLAMISAVAYTIWGILLKYNPVSKVSIFGFTNPVFGVILSTLILKEGSSFGMRGVIALILVCIGIMIVNLEKE